MDDTILDAYFAGLFDGEGSVGIYCVSNGKGSNEKKFYAIKLAIVGTHRPMITKAFNNYGVGNISTQKRQTLSVTPKGNYRVEDATDNIKICKQGWVWFVTSKSEVKSVLLRLLPYLNEKKLQAEICLKFVTGELDGETASNLCKEAKKFNFPNEGFVQGPRRSGGLLGEDNPTAKLTIASATSIRQEHVAGAKVKDLADKWEVSRDTIYRVIRNERYFASTQ